MKWNLWIKHPETNKFDTMLTLATAGFVVCVGIIISYIVLGRQLADAAGTITAILGVTVGSYTTRRFTDAKYGNGDTAPKEDNDVITPDVQQELNQESSSAVHHS